MNPVVQKAQATDPSLWAKIEARHAQMPGQIFGIADLFADIPDLEFHKGNLPPNVSGVIVKNDDSGYTVLVNTDEPVTRRRFTAAHELAHYILHRPQIDKRGKFREDLLLRGGLPNRDETEANQLAAEILMPYEAVYRHMDDNPGITVSALAERFKVSAAAMLVRLGIPSY